MTHKYICSNCGHYYAELPEVFHTVGTVNGVETVKNNNPNCTVCGAGFLSLRPFNEMLGQKTNTDRIVSKQGLRDKYTGEVVQH